MYKEIACGYPLPTRNSLEYALGVGNLSMIGGIVKVLALFHKYQMVNLDRGFEQNHTKNRVVSP